MKIQVQHSCGRLVTKSISKDAWAIQFRGDFPVSSKGLIDSKNKMKRFSDRCMDRFQTSCPQCKIKFNMADFPPVVVVTKEQARTGHSGLYKMVREFYILVDKELDKHPRNRNLKQLRTLVEELDMLQKDWFANHK